MGCREAGNFLKTKVVLIRNWESDPKKQYLSDKAEKHQG